MRMRTNNLNINDLYDIIAIRVSSLPFPTGVLILTLNSYEWNADAQYAGNVTISYPSGKKILDDRLEGTSGKVTLNRKIYYAINNNTLDTKALLFPNGESSLAELKYQMGDAVEVSVTIDYDITYTPITETNAHQNITLHIDNKVVEDAAAITEYSGDGYIGVSLLSFNTVVQDHPPDVPNPSQNDASPFLIINDQIIALPKNSGSTALDPTIKVFAITDGEITAPGVKLNASYPQYILYQLRLLKQSQWPCDDVVSLTLNYSEIKCPP